MMEEAAEATVKMFPEPTDEETEQELGEAGSECAAAVCQQNGVGEPSDYIISRWGSEEGIDQNKSSTDMPPIRKLFVSNISKCVNHNELKRTFSQFGKVKEVSISRHRGTSIRKHFGFVTFWDPEDAQRALDADNDLCKAGGRWLVVAEADPWHQPKVLPDGTIQWRPGRQDSVMCVGDSEAQGSSVSPVPAAPEDPPYEYDETKPSLNILNDDCLLHIFSFLPAKDKIRIERVCKRWQALGFVLWACVRKLDFPSFWNDLEDYKFLTPNILRSFLRRCGHNLELLDISVKPTGLSGKALPVVSKYCSNLTSLNLSGLSLTAGGLQAFSEVSGKLTVLNLDGCTGVADKELQVLFKHCPKLQSITLSHNNNMTGRCLRGLPKQTVQELVMNDCNSLHSKGLVTGISRLENLTKLSINSCINLTSRDVEEITKAIPHVKHFCMGCYFPLFNNSTLSFLTNLKNLVILDLQMNPAVNDRVIENITRACQNIEKLDITGCSSNMSSSDLPSLTDAGLRTISRLPRLRHLNMSYLGNVSDAALEAIAQQGRLRHLECRGCPTFADHGCSSVVSLCNELHLFDLSGCEGVSSATVTAAEQATKLRTNGVLLKLVVGGTSVDVSAPVSAPLLELDWFDYSIPRLRPDFVDEIYFPSSDELDDDDELAETDCDLDWEDEGVLEHDLQEFCDELNGFGYISDDCIIEW